MKRIIDIHSHFNHGMRGEPPTDELYKCDLEFLKEEEGRLGISGAGYSTFASVLEANTIEEENEYLFELCQKDPFVYQWVVVDPRQKKTYEQANKMLENKKVLGIKLHSVYHQYDIMEYVDEIFDFASNVKATVLMHPDKILETAKKADFYPNMNLIIAHIGIMEHIEAIKNSKNKNIYTDTSGSYSYKNNIIEYAVQNIGSERIMFGTDTYAAAFQYGRIFFADISEADKENILYKNAERLFKGKFLQR